MRESQFYGNGKYCLDTCDKNCTLGHCWGPSSHQCQKGFFLLANFLLNTKTLILL